MTSNFSQCHLPSCVVLFLYVSFLFRFFFSRVSFDISFLSKLILPFLEVLIPSADSYSYSLICM